MEGQAYTQESRQATSSMQKNTTSHLLQTKSPSSTKWECSQMWGRGRQRVLSCKWMVGRFSWRAHRNAVDHWVPFREGRRARRFQQCLVHGIAMTRGFVQVPELLEDLHRILGINDWVMVGLLFTFCKERG
jgi:hypothetical protein